MNFHSLGLVNDARKSLQLNFPSQMEHFYKEWNITKGGMPGGDFNGPACNDILKTATLAELASLLGPSGDIWIRYLHSIREVNSRLAMRELSTATFDACKEFSDCFEVCEAVENGVTETLKECSLH